MRTSTLKLVRHSVSKFLFPAVMALAACSLGVAQNGSVVRLDAGEGGGSAPSAVVKVAALTQDSLRERAKPHYACNLLVEQCLVETKR